MTLPADTLPEPLRARFRAESLLGEGTFGRVVLAHDPVLDRKVAVKILRRLGPEVKGAGSRFRREARLLSKLRSPAVVEIYDFGVAPDGAYLVLEYVDGPSLARRLVEPPGKLEPEEAERVADRLLEALEALHGAGVVHRDLKPDNLLFTRTGQLKVTDFGLSRSLVEEDTQTSTGVLVGTPAFMGPDQIDGSTQPGPGWDLYSAGVILWCAVAGEVPLFSNDILVLLEKRRGGPGRGLRARGIPVSPGFDLLVSALLEPRPEARVASAADARRLLAGRPSGALTAPLSYYGPRKPAAGTGRGFMQRPEAALLGVALLAGALFAPRAAPPPGDPLDTLDADLSEVAREGSVLELHAARERLEADPWIKEALGLPGISAPTKALHAWTKARGSFDTVARELNLRRTLAAITPQSLSPAGLAELGRLGLLHRLLSYSGFPGQTPLFETGPAIDAALATGLAASGRAEEPPKDPDEQRRLFEAADAGSGRRWRGLRGGAALRREVAGEVHWLTRVLVTTPAGAPWIEQMGSIPSVVQETLSAASERAELADAPRELTLPLDPVVDELVLALTTDFFPPSLVLTAEIVGKEETVLVPLPVPPPPPDLPHHDDPDRHTLLVRLRRQGLPSGLRLLRLRIVGIQAVAAAESALRIDQVYQLLAGPPPVGL